VHELLQLAVRRQGMEHSYLVSSLDSLQMIGALLGKEAEREATLHILQDWGIVTSEDVDHFSTFISPRRKRATSSRTRGKKRKTPKKGSKN